MGARWNPSMESCRCNADKHSNTLCRVLPMTIENFSDDAPCWSRLDISRGETSATTLQTRIEHDPLPSQTASHRAL